MTILKRTLVGFAVYLIGLHALLSAFAPPVYASISGSFDSAFVICHSDGSSSPEQPQNGPAPACEHCILCTMHAPLAPAPSPPSLAGRVPVFTSYAAAATVATPAAQTQSRYFARGPPLPV